MKIVKNKMAVNFYAMNIGILFRKTHKYIKDKNIHLVKQSSFKYKANN